MKDPVYIVSALRSPIGDFGGQFKGVSPLELIVPVMDAAVKASGLSHDQIGKVILGNTLSPLNPNIARSAAITCQIPPHVPAFSIHCACASAMQALISGVSALKLGETDTALVGGVESMSEAPYVLPSERWGQRLRHARVIDLLWWGMQEDPVMGGMGLAADYLAEKYGISRSDQDELAIRSHLTAIKALENGYFKNQIVPIEARSGKGIRIVDRDEHPRACLNMEDIAKLPPAFSRQGTVTAANASSLNDGAAAIVLATAKACEHYGLRPLAALGPWSIRASDPKLTGIAPVPAILDVVKEARLELDDLELIEINEAFASYYLACEKELSIKRQKVNVNGSGISLGHPVGATGTRIVVTLLHEMIRRDAECGLASLCAGGGMGYALLLRRNF